MGKRLTVVVAFIAAGLLAQQNLSAHHSVLSFDGNRPTEIRGTILNFQWRNPHVYIDIKVQDTLTESTTWTVEAESPLLLERLGWSRSSLTPGQAVTVLGAPARNGRPLLRCRTVTSGPTSLPCFPLSAD